MREYLTPHGSRLRAPATSGKLTELKIKPKSFIHRSARLRLQEVASLRWPTYVVAGSYIGDAPPTLGDTDIKALRALSGGYLNAPSAAPSL